MALQDLLVHLDGTARATKRLEFAAALAARHDAHLIGLHAVEASLPIGLTGELGGAALGELAARLRAEAAASATRTRATFEDRLRRDGLRGEWRESDTLPAEAVALHARYADLVVLGQPDPESLDAQQDEATLEYVLFQSGRPVLMVPYSGAFHTAPERVLVAWNAGREATRAVHDALPLLHAAREVTVLAINPRRGIGGHGDVPAADIALHLARHGVKATAEHMVTDEVPEADVLLNEVADSDIGLIVMGAYGHSRLRQLILGGVTRGILGRMTVPVLMSH
ncbi:universal stress protein [Roseomonas frigidaquae]|uniref:Universal stress protein n=1 Tax=Falsiroseomonas frigidaquae TaxID=487318 RepID=A0ABX1F2Q0_9PROT|nr:universal stress protein [Falsiroseomonas frigidaquae]NKE46625.1 universal stress protein [Falsiroseomonas frigidaquae]